MAGSQSLDDSRDFTIKHIEDDDPCKGVVCEPTCVGDDLHDTFCLEGECVQGEMIEAHAEQCIEVTPSFDKTLIIVVIGVIGIWMFLRR